MGKESGKGEAVITRAILDEFRMALARRDGVALSEPAALAMLRAMAAPVPLRFVEAWTADPDDPVILVGMRAEPDFGPQRVSPCRECGVATYHMQPTPPGGWVICDRCSPVRLPRWR